MARKVKAIPSGRRETMSEEYMNPHKGVKNTSKISQKINDYINQGFYIQRTDAETEAPKLGPPDDSLEKTLMLGKIEGGRRRG